MAASLSGLAKDAEALVSLTARDTASPAPEESQPGVGSCGLGVGRKRGLPAARGWETEGGKDPWGGRGRRQKGGESGGSGTKLRFTS